MSGHKHTWLKKEGGGISRKCECGAVLCSSLSPDGRYSCNQEVGHAGLCQNSSWPTGRAWKKAEALPMKIVVERQADQCLAWAEKQTELYAVGKTPEEALGEWIRLYGELVDVVAEFR